MKLNITFQDLWRGKDLSNDITYFENEKQCLKSELFSTSVFLTSKLLYGYKLVLGHDQNIRKSSMNVILRFTIYRNSEIRE